MSPRGEPRGAGAPYLLDTHIWFWYVLASDRLPSGLREALDAAPGERWLSPISIWELGVLEERGHVRLVGGLRSWVQEALTRLPLRQAELTREATMLSHELDLGVGDPADRFLAATALVHDLTLLTVDERLSTAGWLRTRSC
ncbi:MAG TPA: type II toxin-antitoxin system VapC family toxin [Solirubrobacteraceae bacterium]